MARLKIDYGIDLGTTNSAIARMEHGESVIKSNNLGDTTPSCVYFSMNKRGVKSIKVGQNAKGLMASDIMKGLSQNAPTAPNGFIEFKRAMGTDMLYSSGNMDKPHYTPEELSAEVLKTLKSYITDEAVNDIVVTVPARFSVKEKAATVRAAELAGFKHCDLLQEPVAAAWSYGLSTKQKDAIWMVFDFGGGTFDAALLRVEDGIIQTFDTAGDNNLGGKDLDEDVINKILLPYLDDNYVLDSFHSTPWKMKALKDAIKPIAEYIRIELSVSESVDYDSCDLNIDLTADDNGEPIEIVMVVTRSQLEAAIKDNYQKAVDIAKNLLQKNNISSSNLTSLILVGGPTCSPIVRNMLKEQVSPNVRTDINPMTCVARGAALYASTINAGGEDGVIIEESETEQIVRLDIAFESTSVNAVEYIPITLNKEASGAWCPDKVWVQIIRGENERDSGKIEVDSNGNIFEAELEPDRANHFSIKVFDSNGNIMKSFPNEFTIISGIRVGGAIIPRDLGISTWSDEKETAVFTPLIGLEKNKTYPAKGVLKKNLRTTKQLRPGMGKDIMKVPVYEAEENSEGKPVFLFEYIGDIVFTGDMVDRLIPENTEVSITVSADRSSMMKMDAFFPAYDLTITKELQVVSMSLEDTARTIEEDLSIASEKLNKIEKEGVNVFGLQEELNKLRSQKQTSDDKKKTLGNIQELLRKIVSEEEKTELPRLIAELKDWYQKTERANTDLGDSKTSAKLEELKKSVEQAIASQKPETIKLVTEKVKDLYFSLTLVYICMDIIQDYNENFYQLPWKDRFRARQLLDRGLSAMSNNPRLQDLLPIARELINLLPDSEKAKIPEGLLRG